MSSLLQREPHRADLNMRCKLISCLPCPIFICHVGVYGFVSRQSALKCDEYMDDISLHTYKHTQIDTVIFSWG